MVKKILIKYKDMNNTVKMSFWYLVCSFLQKGIGMITTPIFTRIMLESEYGRYNVYNSWYSIISVFVTLGIAGNCFTRGLILTDSEEKKQTLASSFYGLIITILLVAGIAYVFFMDPINTITGLSTYQFFMMAVDLVMIQASDLWINTKRVKYEYKGIVVLTVAITVIRPLIAIFLVMNAPSTVQVEARITGVAIANTAVFFWIIVYIFSKGKTYFDRLNWKYALTFCIPLIPHYLSKTVLNQSDRIMISSYIGNTEAAYYSIAYTIASIMTIFNSAVAQSLDPWIYRSIKERKLDQIANVSYKLTAAIAIINFMVMAIAPEVLIILAPSSYSAALMVIPPVTASVFFTFMYDLFASFQFYFKKTKWIAVGSCGGAVLNIVLNAIFIPIYGYVAAGYTTLVCYALFGILHYLFMTKVCDMYLDGYKVYDWRIIFGIGMGLVFASFTMIVLYDYTFIRYLVLLLMLVLTYWRRKTIISLIKGIRSEKK